MSRSFRASYSNFFSPSNPRFIASIVWLGIFVLGAYVFVFEPGKSGLFPLCPFRALTGLNCPGCGTTRCLHQLLHGDLIAAFKLNPLFMLSLPFLLFLLVRQTWTTMVGEPQKMIEVKPRYVWPVVGLIICFWVFRNTALYPFPS